MNIDYVILNPAGNITLFVKTAVSMEHRKAVADFCMQAFPSVEQVGYISCGEGGKYLSMQMAGGEFCANAMRSFNILCGRGTKAEVKAPSRISSYKGGSLVELDGISHIVFEGKWPSSESERAEAEKLVKEYCSELSLMALGFMFLNEKEGKMLPLVYVPAADTLFWESSCASGSAACGAYLADKYKAPVDIELAQPGGSIKVKTAPGKAIVLDGKVEIIGEGSLCIPEQLF